MQALNANFKWKLLIKAMFSVYRRGDFATGNRGKSANCQNEKENLSADESSLLEAVYPQASHSQSQQHRGKGTEYPGCLWPAVLRGSGVGERLVLGLGPNLKWVFPVCPNLIRPIRIPSTGGGRGGGSRVGEGMVWCLGSALCCHSVGVLAFGMTETKLEIKSKLKTSKHFNFIPAGNANQFVIKSWKIKRQLRKDFPGYLCKIKSIQENPMSDSSN